MSDKRQSRKTIISYVAGPVMLFVFFILIMLCEIRESQTFVVDSFQWERKIPVEKPTWVVHNEQELLKSAIPHAIEPATGGITYYYTTQQLWTETRSCNTAGTGKNAYWGSPELKNNEREGEREELYFVIAHTDSKKPIKVQIPYEQWVDINVGDPITLSRSLFAILSDAVNSLGGVQDAPAATETLRIVFFSGGTDGGELPRLTCSETSPFQTRLL